MMKQRLEWLDALRGFTMLMVVANHVYSISFEANSKYSMFMSVCLLFRMPLFFFIGGFLAYKATFSWNIADTWQLVRKKLRVQIIPTLFFMTAFIALFRKPFWQGMETAWLSPTKDGYWFTLVLLEMLLAYYVICFIANKVSSKCIVHSAEVHSAEVHSDTCNSEMPASQQSLCTMHSSTMHSHDTVHSYILIAIWAIAFFGYATLYMPKWFHWQKDIFWQATSLTEFVRFFHFFLLGNLCHRHWERLCRWLDIPGLTVMLLAVAFIGAADYLNWHHLRLHWANLPRTAAMYALVLLCVAFFRHYAEWFKSGHVVGRTLQFIGVRTLDVYLLHYFFLPHMPDVGAWFKDNPHNFILEGTVAIAVALLVTAFTLLTSQILRVSPLLRKWLFGRERELKVEN